jgi:hypothetical protein
MMIRLVAMKKAHKSAPATEAGNTERTRNLRILPKFFSFAWQSDRAENS